MITRIKKSCAMPYMLPTFRILLTDLPLGLKTKVGAEGNGISQGQRQRLLIARAVYKNPEYILFDEATNALDANNERVIMDNMKEFFTRPYGSDCCTSFKYS
jgi:ATP-binding cassette subfamily B protein